VIARRRARVAPKPPSLLGKPHLSLALSSIAPIAITIAHWPELSMQRRGFYSRGVVMMEEKLTSRFPA
jgi:hypothetical protein